MEQRIQRMVFGITVLFFSVWALVSLSSVVLGTAGGITSDVLVSTLGLGAWAAAVLGLLAAISIFRGHHGALRIAGDAALVLSASSLASLASPGAGGWAGETFGLSAEASIGTVGAAALFLLLSTIVIAERSPLRAATRLLGRVRSGQASLASLARIAAPTVGVAPAAVVTSSAQSAEVEEKDDEGVVEAEFEQPEHSQTISALSPAEEQSPLKASVLGHFRLPQPSLLAACPATSVMADSDLREQAAVLEETLASYDVQCKVESAIAGPTVVTLDAKIAAGTKMSKVVGLADDLALAFGRKVRVAAGSRPGRLAFEIERQKRAPVGLRELLEDSTRERAQAALPVVLGRGLRGEAVIADLAEMPHAIVAGATGSGKSVCLNAMLCSLLMSRGPDELRLVLVDPKVVELAPYGAVPHMLVPVVTDAGRAMAALGWAVAEMERRYAALAKAGCKNLAALNKKARSGERMAHIVIVVDEFADLMAQEGKAAEAAIGRLAQKARAAGIHLVLATQRPSVDVVTGTIKANFPARIALRVAQRTDSRTILDEQGAEHLAGRGDMLCKLGGSDALVRVQCPMVSDADVEAVCSALSSQAAPVFDESVFADAAEVEGARKPARGEAKVWS
jgi:S-DNA-T family DNA segregation ATPase FtsK/SpoIIIE